MSHFHNPHFGFSNKATDAADCENRSKPRLQFRSPHLNTDLKIDVPVSDQEQGDMLGSAFEFDGLQSPSVGYDKITKLPTPILANGPFPRTIEVKKRNAPLERRKTESLRITSEFEPDRAFRKRLGSVDSHSVSALPTVRHTSNPDPVSGLGMALASPPVEPPADPLQSTTYRASRLGKTYEYIRVIGSGAFSVVVTAADVDKPHETVAIKIISVPSDDASNFRGYIIRELGILSHLDHPCIVKLLDYNLIMSITQEEIDNSYNQSSDPLGVDAKMVGDERQFFFLNYCCGGNLFSWLEQNWSLGKSSAQFWRFLVRIVSEILVTVAHLHGKRIIHRDIKLENVLINKDVSGIFNYDTELTWGDDAVSTITDFGLSKRLESEDQLLTTKCGSQDYVSPELLMGLKYDGKLLDAWSVGVLIYSILENRLPFDPAPADFENTSGISPSVLRRRRSRNRPAHRIAMVDWEWYRVTQMLADPGLSDSTKQMIGGMKLLVESLLVRKENRMRIEAVVEDERFDWIQDHLPLELRRVH